MAKKGKGTDAHEASSLRQAIGSELGRIEELAQVLRRRTPMLRGTVYEHKINCGKASCRRCRRGEYHRRWTLSRTEGGKTVLYDVDAKDKGAWEKQTGEWRQYRKAVVGLKRSLEAILAAGAELAGLREITIEKGKE